MIGICSFGAYIPQYRLSRKSISDSMGWLNGDTAALSKGEKAVANWDEDSLTMAVAAGRDCITGFDPFEIGGVYLGSTSMPHQERQNSAIVAAALGTRENIRSADFTGSLRSGTSALLAAADGVSSGAMESVLVCCSDNRLGKMGSSQEMIFGDGAAAFLIGNKNVIAEYKGYYSLSCDFVDHYRGRFSKFDRQWEDRWIRDLGYEAMIPAAVEGLTKKYDISIDRFDKVIYTCHYKSERKKLNKKLCLNPDKIVDPMIDEIGDTGAAESLVMLARELEKAKPGDKILVVSFGNGCDALYFDVTERILDFKPRKGVSWHLANKRNLHSYAKYLAWRNIVPVEMGMRAEEDSPSRWSLLWRTRKAVLGLCGTRCIRCGTPQYPPQRICVNPTCRAKDEMEDYSFSNKIGKVVSFTGDNLAASIDPPQIYGSVDFEGGGRMMLNFTDCNLESLAVGLPVSLTFRIKYQDEKRDMVRYFWKASPLKEKV